MVDRDVKAFCCMHVREASPCDTTDMVLSRISKQKCNILIVNIIYMVNGLLLYEDYMMNAYVACISVVHFPVLFSASVYNDVCKV